MSQPERYEMLILGSGGGGGGGAGGKLLAWHMAKSGHRTAVVERKTDRRLLPEYQLPSQQNEIWSAKVAYLVHHADRFGIVTGPVATDMEKVLARKRDMVDGLIAMHLDQYKASGAELIMGTGTVYRAKDHRVELERRRNARANRRFAWFSMSGRMPRSRDIPGLAAAQPLHQCRGARARSGLPDHLIVIGGGYVGLELAQAYRRFGSRVDDHRDGITARRPGRFPTSRCTAGDAARRRHRGASRRQGLSVWQGPVRRKCQPPIAEHPPAIRPSKAATS